MIRSYKIFRKYLDEDLKVNSLDKLIFVRKPFSRKYKFFYLLRLNMYLINKKERNDSFLLKVLCAIIYLQYRHYEFQFSVEISPYTKIGKGLYLPHINGIIIHPKTIIGNHCTILQQVTIGNNIKKGKDNLAVIGNKVVIGAGAKIIGPCKIEDNVIIGANAVVTKDIASNSIVAGVPARVIK